MTDDRPKSRSEPRLDHGGEPVEFDRAKLRKLRRCIRIARTAGAESFTMDGRRYLVAYAEYLAQYLDRALPRG